MSLVLMGRVFATPIKSHSAKLVLLALANHAWDDGEHCYPSQVLLARETGLTERTVRSLIHLLEAEGYIDVIRGPNVWGKSAPTHYGINTDRLVLTPERRSRTPRPTPEIDATPEIDDLTPEIHDSQPRKSTPVTPERISAESLENRKEKQSSREPAPTSGATLPLFPSHTALGTPDHSNGEMTPLSRRASGLFSGRPPKRMTDDEWFTWLKGNPAYTGIDLDVEIGKAKAWLTTPKGKGRGLTRPFFLNWLNRADRPLTVNGKADGFQGIDLNTEEERAVMRAKSQAVARKIGRDR